MTDALARATDPDTSHEAAAYANTNETERRVLAILRRSPDGLTSHEIAVETGLSLVTVSPRLKPLEALGLVVRNGRRRTASGRSATVWTTKEAA